MVAARVFLGLCALLWLPYGLMCLANPGSLAESAGVVATTATGTIELRAMYGGLQVAVGALAGLGALRPKLAPSALLAMGALAAGLATTRTASALTAGELSSYTAGALAFEWTMLVASSVLWPRARAAA